MQLVSVHTETGHPSHQDSHTPAAICNLIIRTQADTASAALHLGHTEGQRHCGPQADPAQQLSPSITLSSTEEDRAAPLTAMQLLLQHAQEPSAHLPAGLHSHLRPPPPLLLFFCHHFGLIKASDWKHVELEPARLPGGNEI